MPLTIELSHSTLSLPYMEEVTYYVYFIVTCIPGKSADKAQHYLPECMYLFSFCAGLASPLHFLLLNIPCTGAYSIFTILPSAYMGLHECVCMHLCVHMHVHTQAYTHVTCLSVLTHTYIHFYKYKKTHAYCVFINIHKYAVLNFPIIFPK